VIPAVLTCVFVIYLYRTLNADGTSTVPAADESSEMAELVKRLSSLEERLSRLASSPPRKDALP
jgi:hypothetical protein